MASLDTINVGSLPNDGTGDPLRDAFIKVNSNDVLINDEVGQNTNDIADLDTDKADKIIPAAVGNLAGLDATGNLQDSGVDPTALIIRNGGTALLAAGSRPIVFSSAFADTDYSLIINVRDTSGVISAYVLTAKIASGFTVTLSFASSIDYIAIKY